MNDKLLELMQQFPSLSQEEVKAIAENITVKNYKKGTILLRQGETSRECYNILKGCIRQYQIKEGEEKTIAFFTEGEAVISFSSYTKQVPSTHYLVCAEDCMVTVGSKQKEDEMCTKFPKLRDIIRSEMENNSGKAQEEYANFVTSTPEERYLYLLETKPELFNRVPQHQIASYLGITPESLSRIKKRVFLKR